MERRDKKDRKAYQEVPRNWFILHGLHGRIKEYKWDEKFWRFKRMGWRREKWVKSYLPEWIQLLNIFSFTIVRKFIIKQRRKLQIIRLRFVTSTGMIIMDIFNTSLLNN